MALIQITTTTDKREEAERISRTVVEKKLAACVQILGPINSTYWWEGKMETSEEYLLIIKTGENFYHQVEKTIKEIHSYQVPEIIASPIVKGSKEYLAWVEKVIEGGSNPP